MCLRRGRERKALINICFLCFSLLFSSFCFFFFFILTEMIAKLFFKIFFFYYFYLCYLCSLRPMQTGYKTGKAISILQPYSKLNLYKSRNQTLKKRRVTDRRRSVVIKNPRKVNVDHNLLQDVWVDYTITWVLV